MGDGTLRAMRLTRLLVLSTAAPLALACTRAESPAPKPAPAAKATAPDAGADAPIMSTRPPIPPPPADVFAPPADATREPSGLSYKILKPGTGTVKPDVKRTYLDLRYSGWERNGHQFEGSAINGTPARYDPTELVDGLQQQLGQMVVGEKRRIWVPAALAYAKRTNFANAPKGDMTYDVELVHIVPLPPVPKDVAIVPKENKKGPNPIKATKSGLVYQVLAKGTGKVHPGLETRAEVIYSIWTPDGHMFQTSLIGGDTGTVRVKLLPLGWREAMQMMVEGDKWRLWTPGKLAFGELKPGDTPLPFGPPPGPVVFEVELVKIIDLVAPPPAQ